MSNLSYLDESLNKFKQLEKVIKCGFEVTKNFAEDVDEGDDSKKLIEDLREVMIQYAAMERDVKNSYQAVEHAKNIYQQSQVSSEPVDMESIYLERLDNLKSQEKPEDLLKHKAVVGFTATVWKQHFGGSSSQDEGDRDNLQYDDDLEIQLTQMDQSQRFICPITKTEIIEPVTSRACNHTYSRFAIEQHIKNSPKQRAKCPVAGCVHFVKTDDLEDDEVLAYELRKRKK